MSGEAILEQLAILLSYLMIIMALAISAATTLKLMVRLYQAQAWVLTLVVLLTALEPGRKQFALALLAALPATLAFVAPPLLARASLARARGPGGRDRSKPGLWRRGIALRHAPGLADLTWLRHGRSRLPGGISIAVEMALIAIAVLVAYRLVRGPGGSLDSKMAPSLAVTFALLLQGLFTMSNKRDIIAQIIGLLVIEHGLFLAAVRIAPAALALLLVLSLFFYVLVTLIILLWILPELHRVSASIEVSDHARLKG